jgi:hypothetical protein
MALYIDKNAPGSGLANLMAARGRQGDTELVHMTKPEVQRLMSTGLMSLNPKTGLPEYFLGSIFRGVKNFAKKLLKPKTLASIALGLIATPIASALIPGTLFGATGNIAGRVASGLLRGGFTGAVGGLPWGKQGVKAGLTAGAGTGGLLTLAGEGVKHLRGSDRFGIGPEADPYTTRELENARIMRSKVLPQDVENLYKQEYGDVSLLDENALDTIARETHFPSPERIPTSQLALEKLGIDSTPSNLSAIRNINLGRNITPSQIREFGSKNIPIGMESPKVIQRLAYEGGLGSIPIEQIAAAQEFSDIRPSVADLKDIDTYKEYYGDRGLADNLGTVATITSGALDTADFQNKYGEDYEDEETISLSENEFIPEDVRFISPKPLKPRSVEEIIALYTAEGPKKYFEGDLTGEEIFQSAKKGGIISLANGGAFEGQIQGDGHGMQDNVMMPIKGGGIAAVSPKEYVVPADVMAMLGNGNADEGAEAMDGFISKFRKRKYGRDTQPPETDATKALQSLIIS